MTEEPRGPRPRAFRLDTADWNADAAVEADRLQAGAVTVELQPDVFMQQPHALPPGEAVIEAAQRDGMRGLFSLGWGGLFWSAVGGLLSLGVGLWVDSIIESLFARTVALGWVAVVLAGLAVLALAVLAVKEVRGVFRQSHVADLHAALAAAHAADDRDEARTQVRTLSALYISRASTAAGRAELSRASAEIIDGRDLIDVAERVLMLPIDAIAAREIAEAAKRVSLVTAISPRAILDLLFVAAQIVRLIRRIAEHYSGRPGFFGFLKLAKSVGTHLAVTGGMAVGDSLVQQVLGHGIAAKLSARLGEGVLNGLLTTRVGLSAMAVCRPMPFAIAPQPGVKDVAPFLFTGAKDT